jgi:catechol 2,3-dioxygenase-like lactoylglutathione lyase family enzyme
MLGQIDAIANIAVKDLAVARRFYEETLGLRPSGGQDDEVAVYCSGQTRLFVYRSDFAQTNQATALSWAVGPRVDELARALKAKGVAFEHYTMPGMTLEEDVHVGAGHRIAWFKDPDGNILSLVGE